MAGPGCPAEDEEVQRTGANPVDLIADGDRARLHCTVCGATLAIPFTLTALGQQARAFFAAHEHADR
jgi:hypothetical protein